VKSSQLEDSGRPPSSARVSGRLMFGIYLYHPDLFSEVMRWMCFPFLIFHYPFFLFQTRMYSLQLSLFPPLKLFPLLIGPYNGFFPWCRLLASLDRCYSSSLNLPYMNTRNWPEDTLWIPDSKFSPPFRAPGRGSFSPPSRRFSRKHFFFYRFWIEKFI